MKLNRRNRIGFTLTEIMIVVAIIGLLAAVAIPFFVRARTSSQITTCINNLRQIDSAVQQWAVETNEPSNAVPNFTDISNYMKSSVLCPAAGPNATFNSSYTLQTVSQKPLCQIDPSGHVLPIDTTK